MDSLDRKLRHERRVKLVETALSEVEADMLITSLNQLAEKLNVSRSNLHKALVTTCDVEVLECLNKNRLAENWLHQKGEKWTQEGLRELRTLRRAGMTLKAIGKIYGGLSRERIRQLV